MNRVIHREHAFTRDGFDACRSVSVRIPRPFASDGLKPPQDLLRWECEAAVQSHPFQASAQTANIAAQTLCCEPYSCGSQRFSFCIVSICIVSGLSSMFAITQVRSALPSVRSDNARGSPQDLARLLHISCAGPRRRSTPITAKNEPLRRKVHIRVRLLRLVSITPRGMARHYHCQ